MIIDMILPLGDNPAHDVDVYAEKLARANGMRFVRGETLAQYVRFELVPLDSYRVNADALRVRDAPVSGKIVGLLKRDEKIEALEEAEGWVRHKGGWSSGEFLQLVKK